LSSSSSACVTETSRQKRQADGPRGKARETTNLLFDEASEILDLLDLLVREAEGLKEGRDKELEWGEGGHGGC
jgi:hypothetical protein